MEAATEEVWVMETRSFTHSWTTLLKDNNLQLIWEHLQEVSINRLHRSQIWTLRQDNRDSAKALYTRQGLLKVAVRSRIQAKQAITENPQGLGLAKTIRCWRAHTGKRIPFPRLVLLHMIKWWIIKSKRRVRRLDLVRCRMKGRWVLSDQARALYKEVSFQAHIDHSCRRTSRQGLTDTLLELLKMWREMD